MSREVSKGKERSERSEQAAGKKAAPKFSAPKGFTRQSSNAVGFWNDDGENAILFVPKGVRLIDGNKKTNERKPACILIGELKSKGTPLINKDDDLEGEIGDVVAVFWRPGMGRDIVQAYGIETWIAPLYDENGERKTMDVGRAQPMKLYDVQFADKIGKRIPILEDARKKSRREPTPFDDPRVVAVQSRASEPVEDEPEGAEPADVDDDDVPF